MEGQTQTAFHVPEHLLSAVAIAYARDFCGQPIIEYDKTIRVPAATTSTEFRGSSRQFVGPPRGVAPGGRHALCGEYRFRPKMNRMCLGRTSGETVRWLDRPEQCSD